MARNLLKNPCGEEDLKSWMPIENGGSGWRVEKMTGNGGHAFCDEAVKKYFATSNEMCLKKQVVDLLAEGFLPDALDAQPAVTVEDWYSGRSDCGCTYRLTVSLLDEKQEVLQKFQPEIVSLDPKNDDCSWRQVKHTFSSYGPGVRFISFEHGGKDTKAWAGWYGVRVTGSSVQVQVEAKNLLNNPCGEEDLKSWMLIENGGSGWRVEEMPGDSGFYDKAVKKYFATSFKMCLKKQVVDLLAEGFLPDALDAQPAVTVEDWYCGRTDCDCTYHLNVSLLDANQKVFQKFQPDAVTLGYDDCSWRQVKHSFSAYGPGLRFIAFKHGGQDCKGWEGWYGVRVTGSSATVQA